MTGPSRRAVVLLVLLALAAGACLAAGLATLLHHDPAPVNAAQHPGRVDVGFAQDMAVHHEQALVMAQLALDRSDSAAVTAYARQILVGQAKEQGTLQGWLGLWGAPQLPSGPSMSWMGMPMAGPMPGMATQRQLDELGRRTGKRFDMLFLTLMTRHHRGGIAMAQYAAKHARLPVVRSQASLMVVEQAQEIAGFGRLAAQLCGHRC